MVPPLYNIGQLLVNVSYFMHYIHCKGREGSDGVEGGGGDGVKRLSSPWNEAISRQHLICIKCT